MKRIASGSAEDFRSFVFLFLSIAALALITYGLRDELLAMIAWAGETIRKAPVLGAIAFFFASAASVLFLFVSSALLIPSAVMVWGKGLTFLLLSAGWFFGWMAAYAIGRFFRSQASIEKRLRKRHFHDSSLLSGKLPFSFVLIVMCSLPAEIVGYALGTMRYPFRYFLLALALVEIPFAFLIVFIGESFIHENIGLFIGFMAVLIGILVWEVRSARRMKHPS